VTGTCPFCNEVVEIRKNAKEGDLVVCKSCDTELEIVSLKPVELDWPLEEFDEENDFDYDDDDDFDDDFDDDDDYDDDEWDDD